MVRDLVHQKLRGTLAGTLRQLALVLGRDQLWSYDLQNRQGRGR